MIHPRRIFITGIGTGVGKTIVSAIITEALQADYWKPIQAGSGEGKDSDTVRKLISNKKTKIHPEAFCLPLPASPNVAAEEQGIKIEIGKIVIPETDNTLVIEGAGGIMVPINDHELMLDMMKRWNAEVVLVSRHYLGSINHTLLSMKTLEQMRLKLLGVVFNGKENMFTEKSILSFCNFPVIGRVKQEEEFTPEIICAYTKRFQAGIPKNFQDIQ